MTQLDQSQQETHNFILRKEIKEKQSRMLAFLYNVQYEIAAEKFDQKFAPFSELKIIQKNEWIKSEEVRRIFAVLSERLHNKILREDIECDRALNKLEYLWQTMKIQPFHRYYFQKYLFSTYLQTMSTLIKNEDQLIRKEQHIYFSILRAIWGREASLNQISRQLKQLSPEDMYEHFNTVKERQLQKNRKIERKQYRVHGYRALYRLDQQEVNLSKTKMEGLFEDINNYRKITVHVIELIAKWKEYMCSLTHDLKKRRERIQYYYNEQNHLFSILNDFKFISHSFLSNFYTFSVRNDPFLLRPILALEKKLEVGVLSFQEQALKALIQIKPIELHKIIQAVEHLFIELETNIRNRKAINSHTLEKVKYMSLDKGSFIRDDSESPIKKIKLNPIQRSESLKTSNLGSKQVSFASLTKSNVLIRKTSQISKGTNSFYKKSINPQTADPYAFIQSQKLKVIKEEVLKKVKEQLQLQTKKSLLKSKHFQELVDVQVMKNWNQLLEDQRKQIKETVLEVTPISFTEEQIGSYLNYLFKFIPPTQMELQKTQKDLSNIISQLSYCYFLKIHSGNSQIAHIISRTNSQVKGYKSIEILLVAFKDIQILEKIIVRCLIFLRKYENAKQITFTFSFSTPENEKHMKDLKEKLGTLCTSVIRKAKTHHQITFSFVQKGTNEKYIFNPHPEQMHFKLYSVLTTEMVKLDLQRQSQHEYLYYEYVLMEALKRFTNSQDFLKLRDTFKPKDRLRYLLTLLMDLQNHKGQQIEVTTLSATTISQLKDHLTLLKRPHLQLQDLLTVNNIKMLMLQLTLSPAYSMRVVFTPKGQKMHRYHLHQEIDVFRDEAGTQILRLEVHESHFLRIVVFDAQKYLQEKKENLYEYLYRRVGKKMVQKKYINNLWIEMGRYPQNPTEQSSLCLQTHKTQQFSSIGKKLYVADYFDWFTDIQLQSGLSFPPAPNDLIVCKPMGVGVVTLTGCLLYCRILI